MVAPAGQLAQHPLKASLGEQAFGLEGLVGLKRDLPAVFAAHPGSPHSHLSSSKHNGPFRGTMAKCLRTREVLAL